MSYGGETDPTLEPWVAWVGNIMVRSMLKRLICALKITVDAHPLLDG